MQLYTLQKASFELSDNVLARAKIPPTEQVCLWLGANVMLEYPVADAKKLLSTNLANAKTTLANINNDLAFLKDQITVSEVNSARLHNLTVKQRAAQRAAAEAAAKKQQALTAK
jgi:hypothetical protein